VLVLPALMAGAGLWALLQLPAGIQVPIHFTATGQANGWSDAICGLLSPTAVIVPAMLAVLEPATGR